MSNPKVIPYSNYKRYADIPYTPGIGNDPRQALDLYLPHEPTTKYHRKGERPPLLIYIHGGAWRSESKDDFIETLMPRLIESLCLPVACLDYRLAPGHPHPAQINDIISGLVKVSDPDLFKELDLARQQRWDPTRFILLGHSVGSFIITQLLLCPPPPPPLPRPTENVPPSPSSFQVPDRIRNSICAAICLEGIFDLPDLIEEYPAYSDFVEMAFGKDRTVWQDESPTRHWVLPPPPPPQTPSPSNPPTFSNRETLSNSELGLGLVHWKMLLLHSKGDTLLSFQQPDSWIRHGRRLGLRNDVLQVDYETLKGDHWEVLKEDSLFERIRNWLDPVFLA